MIHVLILVKRFKWQKKTLFQAQTGKRINRQNEIPFQWHGGLQAEWNAISRTWGFTGRMKCRFKDMEIYRQNEIQFQFQWQADIHILEFYVIGLTRIFLAFFFISHSAFQFPFSFFFSLSLFYLYLCWPFRVWCCFMATFQGICIFSIFDIKIWSLCRKRHFITSIPLLAVKSA